MLRLEDVHSYYGDSHVLQGIDLEIEAGEVVCLLGRNGAGKTTTLRSIVGLTPPRTGRVLFRGQPIQEYPPHRIVGMGVGFVPEDRRIFAGLTAHENLEVAQKRNVSAPPRWPLARIYEHFPMLADIRDRAGDRLSGGQQQMLALARALAGEPQLLLLDEPNEGLAPMIVQQIGRLIDDLAETTTILFTEQNIRFTLAHSERVYVIEKGRVRHHAGTEELRAKPSTLDEWLGV